MIFDRAAGGAAKAPLPRARAGAVRLFFSHCRRLGWACIPTCVSAFALIILSANGGYAAEPGTPDGATLLKPRRYEFAGFPIVGGSTDIGVQFGGVATLTRFFDGALPYLWNIDLLLSASLKDDQSGFHLVQQSHVLRLDAPELFGGRARLDARATYLRTINAGYYGLGNATTVQPLAGETSLGRRYQYIQQEGWLRTIARLRTGTPVDVALAGNLRYEAPAAYASSKLAEDLEARGGSPAVIGGPAALLGSFTAGAMIDTRDSEFVTTRGIFYQLGIAATVGSAEEVANGEVSAVLAHYAPLGGPFVFASRVFASFRFGRVPFYDLQTGGAFEPESLLGGDQGVRGVPIGRYAGLVKAVANLELRSTPFPRFHIFGERFRVGTTSFLDAGRVWSDYKAISSSDGTALGLKYGIGGGFFIQWGEAAIFRVEAAYSPDAVSENPGFPLGIYVSDGLMF
ncbi:MAG TPA: BamA/TamA family outer membrane protein [Polyangiaceae bacterium]|nr:BamA/TamA family outer membrane protein [Polyangiaceae bacterium]